jgi:hypothetical protein
MSWSIRAVGSVADVRSGFEKAAIQQKGTTESVFPGTLADVVELALSRVADYPEMRGGGEFVVRVIAESSGHLNGDGTGNFELKVAIFSQHA